MKAFQLRGREEQLIDTLMEKRGEDGTTIVKQAVRTESLLQKAVDEGSTIFVKTKQGIMKQIMFAHMEG